MTAPGRPRPAPRPPHDPPPPTELSERARQLLDAHTAFLLAELRGARLTAVIERELDVVLAAAHRLTLDDVVTREQVAAVALKYVAAFELPGAIPDLAGEIATRLLGGEHPAELTGDVLGREQVDAILVKIAQLPAVRQRIADAVADSPTVRQWLADYLHGALASSVSANRRRVERLPGMSGALSLGDRLAGPALREADQLSREAAERGAALLLARLRTRAVDSLTDEVLADALRDTWAGLAERPATELVGSADQDDVIDAIVLGYELWRVLRTSSYLHSLIRTAIDYIFDTYGGYPLDELLAELGLHRDDLLEEALRFGPPAVAAIDAAGVLEPELRRQLGNFYHSPEAQRLLAD